MKGYFDKLEQQYHKRNQLKNSTVSGVDKSDLNKKSHRQYPSSGSFAKGSKD
jgi:hypothetical protein